MRVYEASTLISAEFGGIRDLSRHLSLNFERGSLYFHSRLSLMFTVAVHWRARNVRKYLMSTLLKQARIHQLSPLKNMYRSPQLIC